jgi:hypothetical protein
MPNPVEVPTFATFEFNVPNALLELQENEAEALSPIEKRSPTAVALAETDTEESEE